MFKNHHKAKDLTDDLIRQSREWKNKQVEKIPNISYRKLFRYATRDDLLLIALATFSTIASGSLVPYALTVIGGIFQRMIDYTKDNAELKNELFMQDIYKFGLKYSMFGCIFFLGGYIGTAMFNITAINQVFKIRKAYLKATLNQDFAFFDTHKTGDFASKMAEDMVKLEDGIGEKLATLLYQATVSVGCILMALIRGWRLALLCMATAPITFSLIGFTYLLAHRLTKKAAVATSNASAVAEEVLSSIRTVMAFNGQQKELDRYRLHLAEARRIEIKKDVFTGLSNGFVYICVFSSYGLFFYMGSYLIVHDPSNYNAGTMYEVFFGVLIGMSTLSMVATLLGTLASAVGSAASIFFLLDYEPTIDPLHNQGVIPSTIEGNIELQDVVFHYPSRPDVTILNHLSIRVKRGQSAALVGHSGCGKSTVLQLVSRYYDPIHGAVSVDGKDVRSLSVVWLRAQVGLVGQEPVLFNTSVRENIRYGRETASDDDVEAAARQANAHHFIARLPNGYDTQVGQGGASLSGGQKQRIAIARALVRNPAILLLDEATSALDSRSEAQVQNALDKASQGRTTLIVAHRLSTIRHVDVIYVLSSGNVVEQGTHDELLALKGHYYEMLALQDPTVKNPSLDAVSRLQLSKQMSLASVYSGEAEDKSDVKTSGKDTHPPLSIWRLVQLNAPEWRFIVLGSTFTVIVGATMPLFVLVYGSLYRALAIPDPDKLMKQVTKCSLLFVLIGFVMGLSTLIESVSFCIAGARLTERLRERMFAHLLRLHAAYYDEPANSTGALCARLSSEAAYVRNATGQRIGVLLQAISSVGLALAVALVVEWRVALVAMSFFPLLGIVVYYQAMATRKESFGTAKMLEQSTKVAVEAVLNVRTVQSLGRERPFLREYVAQLRPALGPAKCAAHLRGIVTGLSRCIFTFINSMAITYGGHLMVTENMEYHKVIIITQALQMVSGQVQNAFTYAPDFQKGVDAASRAVALLETPVLIADPDTPTVTSFKATGEGKFENVEFSYPHRDKIMRGFNLEIDRGKTIALVGQSGEGKSTVITLLERYYDPESGVVSLDNYPLPSLLLNETRCSYGLVSQEPTLFDRSIAENIAYGDNSRDVTPDEIVAAAQVSNIHSFIESLPEGYDTNVGAKGVQLSGGQKQRVAIARALVRKPAILLLDEATSALDTESEKVVQEAIDRAKAGRTCVMIAHRLSTVRDAEVICVVSRGQVAEKGTHAELMALKGLYYELNKQLT